MTLAVAVNCGNEHFSSIFLDESRFAFLHFVQDCHSFVFAHVPFPLTALCASSPVCAGAVRIVGVPSALRKGLSAICGAGKEVTAEATRRRSLSRISFDRDVFCVMSASALIYIWLKVRPAFGSMYHLFQTALCDRLANMAPQLQAVYDAAKVHAQRSRGSATNETTQYRPKESELPVVAPELTSELLHCLFTLPDPRPLAKITINMDSASQWVSRMCRLFFADEYTRHTEGTPSASQTPNMESAFQAVQNALPKLENRVIEFLAEWLVALLAPARHVLETRSPHLSFMLLKEYWFRIILGSQGDCLL